MKKLWIVFIAAALASGADVEPILKGVENRYNNLKTLQVDFSYTYSLKLRKSTMRGTLYLRKPGRMFWQYSAPPGDQFITDGDSIFDYDAKTNQAHKSKLKDAGDLRGALGFLLGKLNFHEDFKQFETDSSGLIKAVPKSDKLLYTEVSFLAEPDFTIRRLIVKGVDGSTYDYSFENEKKNPPLSDTLFHFHPPPGAQIIDESRGN